MINSIDNEKKYYVYGWFNLEWGVYFYVGKGSGYRYKDLKDRSLWFKSIVNNWECEPIILEDNLSEGAAIELETILKEDFILEKGYPIIDMEKKEIIKLFQREGIESAKAKGKHLGRPRIDWNTISEEQREIIRKLYPRWKKEEITATKFMDIVGLKRNTFYKIIKQYEKAREGTTEL